MEQPRVQVQTEIRSERINRVLQCGKCLKYITTSGECECHELLIPGREDTNTMEFYRKYLLCLVKHFIRTGVPNLSPLDENIDFRNETTSARETFYYAANGLKMEFGPWDSEEADSQETQDQEQSISSNPDPGDPNSLSELGTSGNQQNPNHSSVSIEQSLISNPSEGNMEGDDMLNYLQLRLTTVKFMSGKSAVILDILGQHLDWQQILQHVESDTVELRWRFYRFEGMFDEYDYTDYSEVFVENDYGSFDSADADACCCICIDPISVGDETKILPCNHFYHSECIIKWLRINNVCPLCRYELPSDVDEEQRQN